MILVAWEKCIQGSMRSLCIGRSPNLVVLLGFMKSPLQCQFLCLTRYFLAQHHNLSQLEFSIISVIVQSWTSNFLALFKVSFGLVPDTLESWMQIYVFIVS